MLQNHRLDCILLFYKLLITGISSEDMNLKLNNQRKEFEAAAKRQLNFIDKVIAEKKELSENYESLSKKIKTLEIQYNEKVFIL